MLLRQLSYAIKNQLKTPNAPYKGHFLPFAGSLRYKGGFHAGKGSINILVPPIYVNRGPRVLHSVARGTPGKASQKLRGPPSPRDQYSKFVTWVPPPRDIHRLQYS